MIQRIAQVLTLFALFLPAVPSTAQDPASGEFLKETHGDWDIKCSTADPDNCFMVIVANNAQGTPMVEVSLVKFQSEGPASAGATVIVPLGTALPEGVVLQVDDGERLSFPYDFCAPAGCVANLAMTADLVLAMKGGFLAMVTFAAASTPDTPIGIAVSLQGFTAAYNALN